MKVSQYYIGQKCIGKNSGSTVQIVSLSPFEVTVKYVKYRETHTYDIYDFSERFIIKDESEYIL